MNVDPRRRFELGDVVGQGAFAKVYQAKDRTTDRAVAVKKVHLQSGKGRIEDFQVEVAALKQAVHPHIVELVGAWVTGKQLWIVLEYISGGSAEDLLGSCKVLHEQAVAVIMNHSLQGLAYLHGRGQAHRDIKPANILITDDGRCKLCDLGVATLEDTHDPDEPGQPSAKAGGQEAGGQSVADWFPARPPKAKPAAPEDGEGHGAFVGTPFYMAPEVILQKEHDTKADIWSLGMSAIQLLTGKLPRSELHPLKVIWMTPREPAPTLEGKYGAPAKDFIAKCLDKNPNTRPTAEFVLKKHKFVKSAKKSSKLVDAVREHARKREEADYSSGSSDEDSMEQLDTEWDL